MGLNSSLDEFRQMGLNQPRHLVSMIAMAVTYTKEGRIRPYKGHDSEKTVLISLLSAFDRNAALGFGGKDQMLHEIFLGKTFE
jgi:hypothetical protein